MGVGKCGYFNLKNVERVFAIISNVAPSAEPQDQRSQEMSERNVEIAEHCHWMNQCILDDEEFWSWFILMGY